VLAQEWRHLKTHLPEIARGTAALTGLAALAVRGTGGRARATDRPSVGRSSWCGTLGWRERSPPPPWVGLGSPSSRPPTPLAQTPPRGAAALLVRRGVTAAREPRKTERPNDEPGIRADG
jgi:hypothetical protein